MAPKNSVSVASNSYNTPVNTHTAEIIEGCASVPHTELRDLMEKTFAVCERAQRKSWTIRAGTHRDLWARHSEWHPPPPPDEPVAPPLDESVARMATGLAPPTASPFTATAAAAEQLTPQPTGAAAEGIAMLKEGSTVMVGRQGKRIRPCSNSPMTKLCSVGRTDKAVSAAPSLRSLERFRTRSVWSRLPTWSSFWWALRAASRSATRQTPRPNRTYAYPSLSCRRPRRARPPARQRPRTASRSTCAASTTFSTDSGWPRCTPHRQVDGDGDARGPPVARTARGRRSRVPPRSCTRRCESGRRRWRRSCARRRPGAERWIAAMEAKERRWRRRDAEVPPLLGPPPPRPPPPRRRRTPRRRPRPSGGCESRGGCGQGSRRGGNDRGRAASGGQGGGGGGGGRRGGDRQGS